MGEWNSRVGHPQLQHEQNRKRQEKRRRKRNRKREEKGKKNRKRATEKNVVAELPWESGATG